MATHQRARGEEQAERNAKPAGGDSKQDTPVFNSLEELQALSRKVLRAKEENAYYTRWKNPDGSPGGFHTGSRIAKDVFIDPSSVVAFSKLRPGVRIGAKCIVYSSTLGRNSAIGSECEIRDAEAGDNLQMGDNCYLAARTTGGDDDEEDSGVYMDDDVKVGKGVEITNAYIGEKTSIGDDSVIDGFNHIYIGPRVSIGARVKVEDDSSIQQDAVVPDGAKVLRHTVLDNYKVPKGSVEEAIKELDVKRA